MGIKGIMRRNKETKGYHKLLVWQKLKDLLKIVYKLTDKLPKLEEFGLKSQMRRAVVSVISAFVEGYLKKSLKEKHHFLEIAQTSLMELEAQGEICYILGYWTDKDYNLFEARRSKAGYFLYRYKLGIK